MQTFALDALLPLGGSRQQIAFERGVIHLACFEQVDEECCSICRPSAFDTRSLEILAM